jgi:hypothetical protein
MQVIEDDVFSLFRLNRSGRFLQPLEEKGIDGIMFNETETDFVYSNHPQYENGKTPRVEKN